MTKPRPKALSTIWAMKRGEFDTYVRAIDDSIQLVRGGREVLIFSRAEARLLAKRINQCLNETRRR